MKTLAISKNLSINNQLLKFVYRPHKYVMNPSRVTSFSDVFKREVKNNIVMVQDQGKCHYSFYDGDKNIGYAVFGEAVVDNTSIGNAPKDWYQEDVSPVCDGKKHLKPYIYIDEILIEDRIGLTGEYSQRKSGKKYGTMCFQKILEWAQNHNFGTRLSLTPGKTHSDISPNKFYAKIGFEMSPNDIKAVESLEEKYSKEPPFYKRNKNEKINNRWVSRGQQVFLTHPEVLVNYPLD